MKRERARTWFDEHMRPTLLLYSLNPRRNMPRVSHSPCVPLGPLDQYLHQGWADQGGVVYSMPLRRRTRELRDIQIIFVYMLCVSSLKLPALSPVAWIAKAAALHRERIRIH